MSTLKNWRTVVCALIAYAALADRVHAATIDAASCSRVDVGNAVATASNGDTVRIPAGSCTWSSTLTINKAITLRGAGVGSTIILDGVTNDTAVLDWSLVANQTSRMTGIEFRDGGVGTVNYNGVVTVSGSNTDGRRMRVDNCKFLNLQGANLFTRNVLGVIDHNDFVMNGARIPVYVYHENWNNVPYSDSSFSSPSNLGSEQFLFIEDNTFTFSGTVYAITDAYRGARYVARHNTITNGWVEAHGSDSGGRPRGTRAVEVYENDFRCTAQCSYVVNYRSATGVVFNNRISGFITPHITVAAYRAFWPFAPWGMADGTNPWDVNEPGGPFLTGTASSGTLTSVTVSGANWTPNQWVGYSIKKTSPCTSTQCASIISSNTNNTITYEDDGGYARGNTAQRLSFAAGQTFALWKVREAFDQPGRSGGALLTGTNPALPTGWNNQIDDPIYEWNNTQGTTNVNIGADHAFIRAGEHFFNDTPKPGYTPYTYPHPLISGAQPVSGPSPPTGLRIAAQ